MGLSLPHILLLVVVAALLLGGGRFSALMGDVAKGVKQFKNGMAEDSAERSVVPQIRRATAPETDEMHDPASVTPETMVAPSRG